MRKYAILKNPVGNVRKLMIYQSDDDGVHLFLYDNTQQDFAGFNDYWFETLKDAQDCATAEYGIDESDWIAIDDPLPYCQHDTITPIRVKGRNVGTIQWGHFEKLEDGKWIEYNSTK